MAQVTIDGRTLTIPDEIARDDARLKEALEPYYPEVRNATVQRSDEDGHLKVTFIKRAGPKGSLIDALVALPETVHPALLLVWQLQERERQGATPFLELLQRHAEIEAAVAAAETDVTLADETLKALNTATPSAAPSTPLGF